MPSYAVEAFVLRSKPLSENDKLLTLLTREQGRISAIARGARKAGSSLGGSTDALCYAKLMLAKGRQFDYVQQAQPLRSFVRVRGDLSRMAHALVLAELLERTTVEHQPNDAVYDHGLLSMELLDGENNPTATLLWSECRLMGILGYAPLVEECARCHQTDFGRRTGYGAVAGGLLCDSCLPGERGALPLTDTAVRELRLLLTSPGPPPTLEAAGAVRRATRLAWHQILDRDLRSDMFLDDVLSNGDQAYDSKE